MDNFIFESIFEKSENAIMYWDKNLKLIKANRTAAKMLGYNSADEMLGMPYEKHLNISEEDIINKIKKAIEADRLFEILEKQYISKNDKIIWVEAHLSPIYLNNNDFIIQEIDYDITKRKELEEKIELERKRFQQYFELAQTINVILDRNGNILDINNKACEVLKIKKEEAIGLNWFDNFIPQEIKEEMKNVFFKIMSGNLEGTEYYENEMVDKENRKHIISWHNAYIKDSDGTIKFTISSGIDITEKVQYMNLLKNTAVFSTELLHLTNYILSNTAPDELLYDKILKKLINIIPHAEAGSVLLKNDSGVFEYVATYGYDLNKLKKVYFNPGTLKSYDPYIIYNIDKHNNMLDKDRKILKKYGRSDEIKETILMPLIINNQLYGEITLDTFNYSFEEIELNFARIIKSNFEFSLYKLDLERKLKSAAEYDFLTGVFNRQAFMYKINEILKLSKRYNQKVSIIYFDINKFKQVNDSYGHLIGDEVLKFFTKNIKSSIRESDLFGRIGGDEFILALPNTGKDGIKIIIDKIFEKFNESFEYNGIKIKVKFSYGYSIYPDDSDDIDKLIEIADKRMYENKNENR